MAYSRTTKTNQACEKYGENYWFSPYKFTLSEIYRTNMAASYHSRPQSHFHSVTRWKLGSGLHDQMERSDWLLREPANYHAH
jgi:hypothetical protein